MTLLFKQRAFSWFDSYDVYNESGDTVYTVKGQLSWGKCLKIFDRNGNKVATVRQRVFSLFTTFDIYLGKKYAGCVREVSFFRPGFTIDYKGWDISGDFMEWDYSIYSADDECRADIYIDPSKSGVDNYWTDAASKEVVLRIFTNIIAIVAKEEDALPALALTIAIDAEKEHRN